MNIKQELNDILLNGMIKCGFDSKENLVSFSNKPEIADFQCNVCFQLAKEYKISPSVVACQILDNIKSEDYEFSFCSPGYINIKVKDEKYSQIANELIEDKNLGIEKTETPKTIFLDYGGANVAKELHMGHLRSPIIGESIKNLHKLFGNKTISDTHLGDWGLQMGLTIAQLEDDGVLDYYFKGKGEKPKITLAMLNVAYPKASLRKKNDVNFKQKADDYTLFLQQHKEPFYSIWKQITEVSIETIKKNYDKLNIHFDLWRGESSASIDIEETINIFKSKGLTRVSEGALVVDVANENENIPIPKKNPDDVQYFKNPMPPAIIQKYNGGELYITTDLATLLQRNREYNPDEVIYITDNRQIEHLVKVFRCAKMAGISPLNQKLTHIAFGTMNGSDGKPFKTRSGDTIKLEDVIDMVTSKAQEKLTANGIGENKELALQIGVAALKFGDLSNDVSRDYVLDIDKFASFEGKTGPYLQYTIARINSLLSKANYDCDGSVIITKPEERDIMIAILKLIESFKISLDNLTLSPLCNATYALAQAFSTFYNNIRILNEKDEDLRRSYLALASLVKKAIKLSLDVLAIDSPDKM